MNYSPENNQICVRIGPIKKKKCVYNSSEYDDKKQMLESKLAQCSHVPSITVNWRFMGCSVLFCKSTAIIRWFVAGKMKPADIITNTTQIILNVWNSNVVLSIYWWMLRFANFKVTILTLFIEVCVFICQSIHSQSFTFFYGFGDILKMVIGYHKYAVHTSHFMRYRK